MSTTESATSTRGSTRWLFMHGTPLGPASWDDIASRISAVGDHTWCPSLEAPGSSLVHARRLVAVAPAGPPFHVVGHSFGGQVAIDLALEAPELVASLALVCTRDSPYPAFQDTAAALRDGLEPDTEQVLARWFTPHELAEEGPVVALTKNAIARADRGAWADALESIAAFDRRSQMRLLAVATTLIAAELDSVSSPETMQEMAARVPRSTMTILADTSHMGPFLQPERIVALLRRNATR
jgi:3-oxoadipate enol-lactonase